MLTKTISVPTEKGKAMTKRFCDRCGKEIMMRKLLRPNGGHYDWWVNTVLEDWGRHGKEYELCFECANKLKKFLDGYEFDYEK